MPSGPGRSPAGAAARLCDAPIVDALAPHLSTADLRALRLTCRRGRAAFGAIVRSVRVAAPAQTATAAVQAAARAFVNARRAALAILYGGKLPRAALRALASMPSLRELEVQGSWDSEVIKAAGLAGLAGLTALTFQWCALRVGPGALVDKATPALAGPLPQLTALRKLGLVDCGLGCGGGGGDGANTQALLRALPPSLQELDLEGNPLGEGGAAAALAALRARLPQLTALRELNLGNCQVGCHGGCGNGVAAALRALPPSLERLHLDGNPLDQGSAAAALRGLGARLPQLTALRELSFSLCDLGCSRGGMDAMAAVLRALPPSLEELRLEWNPLDKGRGAPVLVGLGARLPQLTALRTLGLYDCHLGLGGGGGDAAAAVLRALPPSLEELRLEWNPLDKGRGAPALVGLGARLPQLTALRRLGLGSCGLGGGGGGKGAAAVLRALPPSLEELYLDNNPICNKAAAAALAALRARLPQLTALRKLRLGGCDLGDSGDGGVEAAAAAVLRELPPSLEKLYLNNNPLGTGGGAAALTALCARLPQLTALRALCLSDCGLGDDGGGEVEAAAAMVLRELPPSLEKLYLDNNPLGSKDGAAALAALRARLPQLTALRKLELGGCGLRSGGGNRDAVAAVLRALPPSLEELRLEWNPLSN